MDEMRCEACGCPWAKRYDIRGMDLCAHKFVEYEEGQVPKHDWIPEWNLLYKGRKKQTPGSPDQ